MKKIFITSFIFLSITSCAAFKEQRITINSNPIIAVSKIGQKEKIKVNIYKESISIGDNIGNRIPPNVNGSRQGLVTSASNLDDIIKHKLQEWLQSNDFLVVESGNKKTLNARVIYLNYKISQSGFIEGAKITANMAIKITVSDGRNNDLYSKLYLIENNLGSQPNGDEEVPTRNINTTIGEILNKIFSDENLINNLSH